VWTPRRILLLFSGLAVALVAYGIYGGALGGIDGLPALPDKYLAEADGRFPHLFVSPRLPVETRIEQAFGPKCPELEDPAYKTKLDFREKGLLLAAGALPEIKEPTKRIRISPLSLAVFPKPDPAAKPDEVPEIVTLHADEAIVEFDKAVATRTEILQGQARVVGVELIGNPETPGRDVRKGKVLVTHNQKSTDPGRWLVVRTPGPVFYRAPDPGRPPSPDVPTVRTSAAVEIETRSNVPQPLWGQRLSAVASSGDDLRTANAVADIVYGRRAPPPTATAVGLKIYFSEEPPGPATPGAKVGSPQTKLRSIHLGEQVQFNAWAERAGGFPGSTPAKAAPKPAPDAEPPMALAAAAGAVVGGRAVADMLANVTLLTVETRGPFTFDATANVARFEIAPAVAANQANNVEVVRVNALGQRDTLICQRLELAFESPDPAGPKPAVAGKTGPAGGLRSLHAAGPFVRLDSETESFIAQGTELRYGTDGKTGKSTLTFKGSPIDAVKDRHRLKVGGPNVPADLLYESWPGKPGPKGEPTSVTALTIRGPGGVAFYDPATRDNTTTATWASTMTQVREVVAGKDLELLTFDGGRFADAKGGFDLSGETLKLWVDSRGKAPKGGPASAVPHRLQAIKSVSLKSPELIVDETDALSVYFRQTESPPQTVAVAPGGGGPSPAMPAPAPPAIKPAEPPPAKPPNPLRLTARTIDAWVARSPVATAVAKPGESPAAKYDLERAECVDRVDARQAPSDPTKHPRGLELRSAKLSLERHTIRGLVGYAGTLLAAPGDFAEFHYEGTSLAGPKIALDQLANFVRVDGAGAFKTPAGGAFTNVAAAPSPVVRAAATVPPPPPNKSSELTVEWAERMEFRGSDGMATFAGKVQAKQVTTPLGVPAGGEEPTWGHAYVLCHQLDLRFDRPIYFNQFDREPRKPGEGPKVSQAVCRPAPADDAGAAPRTDGYVIFEETQRRRDQSVVKRQRVRAASFDFRGAEDKGGTLLAGGPGEVRILQLGTKDRGRPGAPGPVAGPNELEMKLTLATYRTRLRLEDRGTNYQEAVFEGDVVAFHVPTADFELALAPHSALPERSTVLTSEDALTVSTYKPAGGKPEQKLDAQGNATFRTDEYRGRANRIAFDGRVVTLDGAGPRLALIERATNAINGGTGTPARRIEYDTVENRIKIVEGASGSFSTK
jgi:hypothetical protein